jgi:hypothetical protein
MFSRNAIKGKFTEWGLIWYTYLISLSLFFSIVVYMCPALRKADAWEPKVLSSIRSKGIS